MSAATSTPTEIAHRRARFRSSMLDARRAHSRWFNEWEDKTAAGKAYRAYWNHARRARTDTVTAARFVELARRAADALSDSVGDVGDDMHECLVAAFLAELDPALRELAAPIAGNAEPAPPVPQSNGLWSVMVYRDCVQKRLAGLAYLATLAAVPAENDGTKACKNMWRAQASIDRILAEAHATDPEYTYSDDEAAWYTGEKRQRKRGQGPAVWKRMCGA